MISFALVAAMMAALSPSAMTTGNAPAIARAIAAVVTSDTPPGMDPELAAAILVVTAYEESRFVLAARRGDIGRSPVGAVCAFQVHARDEAQATRLERDPIACTRAAFYVLRIAATRTCVRDPIAAYAGNCNARAAKAIASRRLSKAHEIRAMAAARLAETTIDDQ